jgi:phosphoribosylformylglycinamidine synthase subunit PurQ / glutaminase
LDGRGGRLNRLIAVLQLPGSNCEAETVRAIAAAGGSAEIARWNLPTTRLEQYAAYVIPGGFSYQDRIRAGAVAARLPLLSVVARRAAEGVPVLGICNGAQVLVEAGLVPRIAEGRLDVVLGPNRMPGRDGYYTRWVLVGRGPAASRCLFTKRLGEDPVAMPMAHGEGRFTTRDRSVEERFEEYVAMTYRTPAGTVAETFPWNPNGSLCAAAGITNRAGNVLAMMPHPERAVIRATIPDSMIDGPCDQPDAPGPGLAIFQSLVEALA